MTLIEWLQGAGRTLGRVEPVRIGALPGTLVMQNVHELVRGAEARARTVTAEVRELGRRATEAHAAMLRDIYFMERRYGK